MMYHVITYIKHWSFHNNFVFIYYSASRIDGDTILVSKSMFFSMKNPMMTLKNPYDSWLAVFEINRNDIYWSMGSMDPTCTRQESMKPILICYWDLSQHEKGMPPSPHWDGLPIYDAIFKMADIAVKLLFRL